MKMNTNSLVLAGCLILVNLCLAEIEFPETRRHRAMVARLEKLVPVHLYGSSGRRRLGRKQYFFRGDSSKSAKYYNFVDKLPALRNTQMITQGEKFVKNKKWRTRYFYMLSDDDNYIYARHYLTDDPQSTKFEKGWAKPIPVKHISVPSPRKFKGDTMVYEYTITHKADSSDKVDKVKTTKVRVEASSKKSFEKGLHDKWKDNWPTFETGAIGNLMGDFRKSDGSEVLESDGMNNEGINKLLLKAIEDDVAIPESRAKRWQKITNEITCQVFYRNDLTKQDVERAHLPSDVYYELVEGGKIWTNIKTSKREFVPYRY